MLRWILHGIFGLVVGIVAKWLMPGKDPGGLLVTALLGMAGAWVGSLIGHALGWYKQGQAAGFIMSVVGALALLFAYRMLG